MLFIFVQFLLALFLTFAFASAPGGEASLKKVEKIVFPLYSEGNSEATTHHGSYKRKYVTPYARQIDQWNSDQERNNESNNKSNDSCDQVASGCFAHPAVWYNSDIGSDDEGEQGSAYSNACSPPYTQRKCRLI